MKGVLIDPVDLWILGAYKWRIALKGPNKDQPTVINARGETMAREILQPPKGKRIVYLNGNRLDCRRKNLTFWSQAEEQMRRKTARNPKWALEAR